jgi:hypothetical protein
LPSVNALYQRYRPRGLEVRLVNVREPADVVRRTVEERGYTAPVLLDEQGHVAGGEYDVSSPPTVYLVDRGGNLIGRVIGSRAWNGETARRLIEQLLVAPPAR